MIHNPNKRIVPVAIDPKVFSPHDGQRAFLEDSTHRYVAFAGGWGAGKTWAGARKLAKLHLHNAFDERNEATFVKGLIIAPTYALAKAINIPEMRSAFDTMNLRHRWIPDPRRFCFELPDLGTQRRPSEILVRSADAAVNITGFQVGHIWGDEAGRWRRDDVDPTQDALIQADGRLRDPAARLLQMNLTFTHEGDATRVYEDFEEKPKPDHALYRSTTEQNPHMAGFAAMQRTQLTPELAGQYLDGKAISFRGGQVYGAFDALRNVDAELRIDEHVPLQLACDFNIEPGMHAIIGQYFAHADLLTSVHEIHAARMDVRGMIAEFRRLIEREFGRWQWEALQVYGDASGGSKWAGTGESCWDIVSQSLRNAGMPFKLKIHGHNPPVGDRVNVVNCALCGLDGRVRYKIHPRCRRLIDDMKYLKWNQGEIDKSDRKRSHASDADGYRVHYLMPIQRLRTDGGSVSVAS